MKKNIIIATLLCSLFSTLQAHDPKNQSTVPSYAEFKVQQLDFKNSRQKKDGTRYTLTLQHQVDAHCFKAAFEMGTTNTKQPPLPEDLDVEKFYLRYTYHLDKEHIFNAGFINVQDNLAPTDGGTVYNLGYNYILNQQSNIKFNLYYSHYDIFDSYQGDIAYQYVSQFEGVKTSVIVEGKYIHISDCDSGFCSNAKESYFTPGIRLKAAKNGYFIHGGAYFAKRAFAVMAEGFMLQHHAMEFSKTYMMGIGKRWQKYAIKFRYVTQEAEELPYHNGGVKVNNLAMMLSYYF